jgi:hypothetical protein
MRHHIIYWQMAKRETDVDDTELAALRESESRGEAYIEFLDGQRLTHAWDNRSHRWRAVAYERDAAA